jgi:hypothetical protein
MNRIELQDNGFPMTAKTLRFLQETNKAVFEALARAHGNCILYGVESTPSGAWTDGAIVYNGEIVPFVGGGVAGGYFRIVETSENAIYKNGLSIPAYFTRVAQVQTSSASAVLISGLKRINEPLPANTAWATPTFAAAFADMATYPMKCRIQGGKGQIVGTYECLTEYNLMTQSPAPVDAFVTILTLPFRPKTEQWIRASLPEVAEGSYGNMREGLLRITTGGALQVQYNVETRGLGLFHKGVIAATFDIV